METTLSEISYEKHLDALTSNISSFAQVANIVNYMSLITAKNILKIRDLESSYVAKEMALVENKETQNYAICLGYRVKEHYKKEYYEEYSFTQSIIRILNKNIEPKKRIYATQYDSRRTNILEPILIDDDSLRQHLLVIGTTGSGKTQLLKGILEQQIGRGGGALAVFGKADNAMLQQIYSVAAEYDRHQDLFIVDWLATKEQVLDSVNNNDKAVITNSINLFDFGTATDIINLFLKISNVKDTDSWGIGAKQFLEALLKMLILLREAKLTFNVDKIDEILLADNTLDALIENYEDLNYYNFAEYIVSTEKLLKLIAVIEKIYQQEPTRFDNLLFNTDNKKLDDTTELYESFIVAERDMIHKELKNVIQTQSTNINISKVLKTIIDDVYNGFNKILSEVKSSNGAFYKIEVSQSHFGKVLSFFNKFSMVLQNRERDFDFIEAIRSGKLVVFNIPGQDSEDASTIGKLVFGVLQLLVKKQAKAYKLEQTHLCILDEINSWAKGRDGEVLGLGDVMSVIRGLGLAGIIAYQSDLESLDMGKGIEAGQAEANANTIITLKNNDNKIIKKLNERVPKRLVRRKKDEIRMKNSSKNNSEIVTIEEKEEDFFKAGMLQSLKAGQGYIIRENRAEKMITYYLANKMYSKKNEATLPITKTMSLDQIKRIVDDKIEHKKDKELKENDVDLTCNSDFKKPKTKSKKAKIGDKFEQFLAKRFKADGYNILDGTSEENYAILDAEGVDLVAEKSDEIVIIQAKNWHKKELDRNEAILICEKLRNFYNKTYYDKKESESKNIYGLLAINENTKITDPAKLYLQDKKEDPNFKILTKSYKFEV
ncbi:restriction endonuclease [Hydrogenimonas thermophila]|uniref:Restriction endonuclease n=1 Tax=Hydrogenimonas thermophila TaxID=223786 RepID=A0A1I5ULN9_9BACT|nr:restriction endonuclease [Hydrogenimonas thermophila]SFP96152.1 Restriction endonuclease [Hydrogenimonas thermophila]